MKNLIATTSNLSSILREVKDRTVELKISEVCLYLYVQVHIMNTVLVESFTHAYKCHVYTHTHSNTLT